MRQLYRMHDASPRGVFPVESAEEARSWNARGFGIFWSLNAFRSTARRIENLERILAWAVDMDDGTKDEQLARIASSPLVPSLVVETRRGFQAYWRAKNAKVRHWNAIVLERLVPYFGADKNARDLARILRAPGYLHLKDPADPFPVAVVHELDVAYHEADVASRFPASAAAEEERARKDFSLARKAVSSAPGGLFERLWATDQGEALARLSGHPSVNGEVFTFRQVAGGNLNIYVDGKGTSCWLDRAGRIGSLAGGGPTVYQWLRYYGNSPRRCVDVIKELFPEFES